jgi:hypothetical protein
MPRRSIELAGFRPHIQRGIRISGSADQRNQTRREAGEGLASIGRAIP